MTLFASLRSALANNRRTVIAATAAAAIVAGVMGTAGGIAPTLETGRTIHGTVDIVKSNLPDGVKLVFTVPAGKAYTLTDIVGTNNVDSGPSFVRIVSGSSSSCATGDDMI